MINPGIENENKIIEAINGKKLEDLDPNFQEPIKGMYKYHKEGSMVEARKVSNRIGCKTDIEIQMYNHYHNVSIKSGFGPAVHEEEFTSFYEFLKSLNISNETLETIKFYHYGDGTLDGSGKKTLRLDEFKEKYKDRIAKANKELANVEIAKAVIYRAVIKGRIEKNQEINYLYYGNEKEGIFVKRCDILEFAPQLNCYYDTAIHFGPLSYNQKIHSRKVVDGKVVQYSQLVWGNIKEGVLEIKRRSVEGAKANAPITKPVKEKNNNTYRDLFITIGAMAATFVILMIIFINI
jgi:hypothetical protein